MSLVKKIIRRIQFERSYLPTRVREGMIARIPEHFLYQRGMISMPASLRNLRRNGFRPGSIIDIGAFHGEWSRMARRIFPEAPIRMFDANSDKDPILNAACKEIGQARHRIALLGSHAAEPMDFYVMEKGFESGSSVLSEITSLPRSLRRLETATLDDLFFSGEELPGPYFVKLDVQGFELEVLRGAQRVLANTEVAQLEIALLPYNEGAPLLAEVIAFLQERGLVTYDVCGYFRRESDDALYMVDLLFAREDSALRAKKPFWKFEAQYTEPVLRSQLHGQPAPQQAR